MPVPKPPYNVTTEQGDSDQSEAYKKFFKAMDQNIMGLL
jgi:hypothetical protein